MAAVVNVKQITAWTPFQKQIQDQIQQLLKADEAQKVLKDTGLDPLRDIDRVILVSAADSYKILQSPMMAPKVPAPPVPQPIKPGPAGAAPAAAPPGVAVPPPPPPAFVSSSTDSPFGFPSFILIQGKFDADKLEAKAKQTAKDMPGLIQSHMVGGIELWDVTAAPNQHVYLAMLDKGTILMTGLESQALEALDKANGKRKTDLKDKTVGDALAKLDPKAALQVTASGALITQVTVQTNPKGGLTTTTKTLRDDGFEGYRGTVGLGDADVHYELTMTAKDADKAKETAKNMTDGVAKGIQEAKDHPEKVPKELLPLVDALKAVKIAASGDTISVEGSATADAAEAAVKVFPFRASVRSEASTGPPEKNPLPPPPPPDLPKKDK